MLHKRPKEANEYVLLQRTSLIHDNRSKLTKRLSRIGLGKTYEETVKEQAKIDNLDIEKGYYKTVRESFERIKSHIPNHTKSILDIGLGLQGLIFIYGSYLKKI